MNPQELASQLVRVLADVDSNTAHTALKIAELLISHRDHALLDFEREASASGFGGDAP